MKTDSIQKYQTYSYHKMLMTIATVVLTTLPIAACNNSETTSVINTENTKVTDKKAVSIVEKFKSYYTGKNNCHIGVPHALVYNDAAVDGQLNSTVISFFTMMTADTAKDDADDVTGINSEMIAEIKDAVARGCDVNEQYENNRALELALLYGNKPVFTFLIENGANPLEIMVNDNPKINGLTLFEVAKLVSTKADNDVNMKNMAEHVLSYEKQFTAVQ